MRSDYDECVPRRGVSVFKFVLGAPDRLLGSVKTDAAGRYTLDRRRRAAKGKYYAAGRPEDQLRRRRDLLRREVTEDRGPLTPSLAGPLRDALLAADFTYDAVAELLGPEAHAALSRNETTPAFRRVSSGRHATLLDHRGGNRSRR